MSLSFILHSDIAAGGCYRALHVYRIKVVNVTWRDLIQESKGQLATLCLHASTLVRLKKTTTPKQPTSVIREAARRAPTDAACATVIVRKHGLMTNIHTRVTSGVWSEREGVVGGNEKKIAWTWDGPGQLLILISAGSQMFWKTLEGRF